MNTKANPGYIVAPELINPKVFKPEDFKMEDIRHLSKDSLPLWCLSSGVKVDNNVLDFNTHRYLLPIYSDTSKEIVWRKAAQLGATVYMLLRILWWLENHQGRKAGLYFPTKEGVENLSKDRLTPIIQSCPSIASITDNGDKLGLRKIGQSSFYLYHLGGVASKDAVPLDALFFDEVRLCDPKDIDQAQERVSHSLFKYLTFMSTSGMEGDTIDARFKHGTQHTWHSMCGCGSDGVDLASMFPDCIVADDPKRPGEVYLRCPKCKYVITDPQNGKYVPHNPGAEFNSYAVSQLASKYITPKEIWSFYKRTTNIQEFYNAKLGLPYTNEQNRGVTKAQLDACIDTNLSWGKPKKGETTVMGVDQGLTYLVCVIANVSSCGTKKHVKHVEVIERANPYYYVNNQQADPFVRLHELMSEYNVGMCLIDAMPNYAAALSFAQQYPAKVFLANYIESTSTKDLVTWNDRAKQKEAQRKAGPILRFKYSASINRYAAMSFALAEWAEGDVRIPNPDMITQVMHNERSNNLEPESPGHRLFRHLLCYIRQFKESNPETGVGKWEWIHTSPHDHLAHAWLYCTVAMERHRRRTSFSFA